MHKCDFSKNFWACLNLDNTEDFESFYNLISVSLTATNRSCLIMMQKKNCWKIRSSQFRCSWSFLKITRILQGHKSDCCWGWKLLKIFWGSVCYVKLIFKLKTESELKEDGIEFVHPCLNSMYLFINSWTPIKWPPMEYKVDSMGLIRIMELRSNKKI